MYGMTVLDVHPARLASYSMKRGKNSLIIEALCAGHTCYSCCVCARVRFNACVPGLMCVGGVARDRLHGDGIK